jgi:hypothetical protein
MNKDTAPKGKDVIYVDVDDEITGIIEKVKASSQRIVALVLPKRATMLQSVVNMKLLKRAGETADKHIVLITSEAGLLPLAGSAGIHVAKSLQSKPEVPDSPNAPATAAAEAEATADTDAEDASGSEPAADKSKTVGELSGDDEDEAPIELDNAEEPEAAAAGAGKGKKAKKFKIPNFNKFRMWLLLGGAGLILLIGGIVWALVVMPKADVVISTDSSAITSSREILLETSDGAELNADEGVLPAQSEEITRTQRAEVDATGEENKGEKAKGSITMSARRCAPNLDAPNDIPAGTGVSTDGKTYITQETAEFSFNGASGSCVNYKSGSISIVAQDGGESYNVNNQEFSVVGRSGIDAQGSAKGGTDNIVKIVSQSDIDKAKQQIRDRESDQVKQEVQNALTDAGLLPIPETFDVSTSNTDVSAQVGDEADSVTVTEEVRYTMLGVQQADLERVVSADIADDIDPARQTILDYGLADASFTLQNRRDNGVMVGLRTVVVAGPDLNVDEIKKQIAGKKANDAKTLIGENPGVTNVEVTYGPFWVRSIPSNTSKITVTIEEPEAAPEETDNSETNDNNADQQE